MRVLVGMVLLICLMAGFAGAHEGSGHHHSMGKRDIGAVKDSGVCPVTGEKAMETLSYEYNGKKYNFCCADCIDAFKKDPEKYIAKIKEFTLEAYQYGYAPEVIKVKKDDIVRLMATSRDVEHGVLIKAYKIDVAVKKGEVKNIEFLADKTGVFPILCSVYCGSGHHAMKAKLIVE